MSDAREPKSDVRLTGSKRCLDCGEDAGYRIFLVGFAKPVHLCATHAIVRENLGEVGRAVRLVGGVK